LFLGLFLRYRCAKGESVTDQQEILAATHLAWEDFVDSPEAIDHAVDLIEEFDAEKLLELAKRLDQETAGRLFTALILADPAAKPVGE
jgi:hypothetical protein